MYELLCIRNFLKNLIRSWKSPGILFLYVSMIPDTCAVKTCAFVYIRYIDIPLIAGHDRGCKLVASYLDMTNGLKYGL